MACSEVSRIRSLRPLDGRGHGQWWRPSACVEAASVAERKRRQPSRRIEENGLRERDGDMLGQATQGLRTAARSRRPELGICGGMAMRRAGVRARFAPVFSILAGLALAAFAATAAAQAPEMRFARQFSMGYLQFNLMEKHQLLEKHAKAAGIPEVKVVWATFNSPAAMNDALLSGSVDIVSGGVPGLLDDLGAHAGHAQRRQGHRHVLLAADPAQHPQPQRQDDRRLHRAGQDRRARRQGLAAGHDAADGGRQAVGPGQLRQARSASPSACRRRTPPSPC